MTVLSLSFLIPLIATVAGTWLVLGWLRRKRILDHPNERSSHRQPTPRGGGLAVTPVIVLAWAALTWQVFPPDETGRLLVAAGGALVLLILSWLDDRRGLSARLRIRIHFAVVMAGVASWPDNQLLCQGLLPLWGDRLVMLGAWVWFLNLFNFMDGIDGISGVETATIGCGLAWLALQAGDVGGASLNLIMVGAALGFLAWNWHPAKIFLGDSGSVPIGYLLGWLLLSAASSGHWAAALILPAYYLSDATLTLGKRAFRGERVWEAHRQHFYQQAVQAGVSHASVSVLILLANLILVALAVFSEVHPWAALAAAAVDVALLLMMLARLGK
jgi:UDP-N-acetylmuramyl pentapeptide phosphotransferase/UDP-N-acetylglucosamine-1-phosphate transferase